LIGLSHQTAPVELRERLDFQARGVESALQTLGRRGAAREAVVLSTCNRAELYATCEDLETARRDLQEFLSEYHGVSQQAVAPHLYERADLEVARHLFRVAAGLDSLVVGEPQILGQVKDAHNAAAAAQSSGTILNRLFHASFAVGKRVRNETSLGAGAVALPPGVTADASLDIKAWVLTAAANYRALSTAQSTFDVFAGARFLDATGELQYSFNVDLSPFGGPPQRGAAEASDNKLDAVVGLKGRYEFGTDGRWFIPYYADAGTGDSDLTWQAAIGIGYSTGRGEVFAAYRHLDYDLGDDGAIASLDFDGPAVGLAYRW